MTDSGSILTFVLVSFCLAIILIIKRQPSSPNETISRLARNRHGLVFVCTYLDQLLWRRKVNLLPSSFFL